MPCVVCGAWERAALCKACRTSLRRPPARLLPSGLRVLSAYVHEACARILVHRLKYRGLVPAAELLAAGMEASVGGVEALVPVPRVLLRRIRYGIDQAEALARALSRRTGLPVLRVLSAPLWAPRHAGMPVGSRVAPRLRSRAELAGDFALIDDVVTTGATLDAAVRALSVAPKLALTATAARSSLPDPLLGSS